MVRLFERPFDTHAEQWNFAIEETEIKTNWILALDADYVLTPELVYELRELRDANEISAYHSRFRYCVQGKPLRGSLYPSVTVLFRRGTARYVQDGHTQRLKVAGPIGELHELIDHDDRKPLSRWLEMQDRYMRLEAELITSKSWSDLTLSDKIRRVPCLAPPLVFAYCYFGKRLFLDGKPGLYYAIQRLAAEVLLALRLVELKLIKSSEQSPATDREPTAADRSGRPAL